MTKERLGTFNTPPSYAELYAEVERLTKYAAGWESAAQDLGAKCQRREIEIERLAAKVKDVQWQLLRAQRMLGYAEPDPKP